MKKRLTYFAAVAVLADALVVGAMWHAGPTVGLAAALAVPRVETMLAPLYAEPVTEETSAADVYRPAHSRATIVLLHEAERTDSRIVALARALARRELTVVVPRQPAADPEAPALHAALAYARGLGRGVHVERAAALLEETPASPVARLARAFDLLRLANVLLAAR